VTPGITLRPARPDEKPALDALCFRAKAHWGYDADFMARSRDALRVPDSAIRAGLAFVAADADRPLGVASFGVASLAVETPDIAQLDLLFVEPAMIGTGIGAALFELAAATARAAGATRLDIHADPFAAGFYDRMGARRIGDVPSDVIPGRLLPLYRLDL
jgi:GNAT superfamily N-acetyltransferase